MGQNNGEEVSAFWGCPLIEGSLYQLQPRSVKCIHTYVRTYSMSFI